MDIALAKTFLEVCSSGSFVSAAKRLRLTQTAISARIRALERELDQRLFVRNKAGARLTPAGQRFARHATTLLQVWERARNQVALPPGREEGLNVGAELSLWYPLLADWLVWMRKECPEIALHVEVESRDRLLARIQDGTLDFAVLYSPPQRPDLVSELLREEKLILVTTDPKGRVDPGTYISVDWGPVFSANHHAAFLEMPAPAISISLGPLALACMLSAGGSGYFRVTAAQPYLDDGRLRRVKDAPEFSYSAHVVYATRARSTAIDRALAGLRQAARPAAKPKCR